MRGGDDILSRALGSLREDARSMRFSSGAGGGKPLLVLSISAGDAAEGGETPTEVPADDGLPSAELDAGESCAECGMSGGEHSEDCVHCEY
jgi:hypothetical protein